MDIETRTIIDEAKIVVDSAYVALDQLTDPSEIDAIRRMLAEADDLLEKDQNALANA
jgi:hypothetical protein